MPIFTGAARDQSLLLLSRTSASFIFGESLDGSTIAQYAGFALRFSSNNNGILCLPSENSGDTSHESSSDTPQNTNAVILAPSSFALSIVSTNSL